MTVYDQCTVTLSSIKPPNSIQCQHRRPRKLSQKILNQLCCAFGFLKIENGFSSPFCLEATFKINYPYLFYLYTRYNVFRYSARQLENDKQKQKDIENHFCLWALDCDWMTWSGGSFWSWTFLHY